MRYVLAALLLAVSGQAFAAPAPPPGCSTCIQNTATPQDAQINIGTATIRGTLTVSTLSVTNLTIATLNATTIVGSGSGITNLNASALASGTVPVARLSGAYTGITAVGTLAAGVWNGTVIGTQYGGSGQNWSAVGVGALPYFSGTGTMTTLAAGASNRLLQANGAGAPTWTASPTVLGTNITAIPLANLQTGNLPSAIKATDASLVTVSGSKVSGNISGNAAGISGTLALNKLEAGTLAADILAQTLVPSGVTAGTYGLSTFSPQLTINAQGIITDATMVQIPAVSTSAAWVDRNNNWTYPQTSQSSWTFKNDVLITGTLSLTNALAVTSGGTGRATLTANAMTYGLGTSAIGLLPVMGNGGLVIGTGAVPSTGTLTGTSNQVTVTNAAGKITLSTPQDIGTGSSPTFAALSLTAPLTTTNGGTGNNWSAVATGAVPYFSGTGVLTTRAAGTNGYTLTMSGGVPVWAAASSSATHLSGGTAGAIPYQSAPNATAFLPAMSDGSIVIGAGFGVAPTTGTLTGTANQVTVTRNGAGIVLSGPQNLGTGSSPTFAGLTLSSPLTVANGGTGLATLTANGVLVGNGTGNLINLPAMGALGMVIGNGTGVVPSTATLTGTASQVTVTQSATAVTLSLPATINVNTSGTAADIAAGAVGQVVYQAASGDTQFLPAMGAGGIITGNGTSAIPSTGTFTGTANQVIITRTGSNIVLSGPQDLGTGSSPTFVTVTAALSGNATTATTATNLAGGAAGRIPMQTASGTTTLLPAMGALGMIVGNGTSAVASTATLTGTASQVTVTQSATAVTLSLPATINVNTSGTAALATDVAAGAVGQFLYQNASNDTVFLPAMGAGGIITGNGTSAIPSTGTFTGTSNQVVITRTGSNIVLSTPQDIGTGSSPTFGGLTLSSQLTVGNGGTGQTTLTANGVLVGNGSSGLISLPAMGSGGIITGSGTGVRPSTGTLTGTANQVVVTQTGSNIVLSGPQNLGTGSSPTFVLLTASSVTLTGGDSSNPFDVTTATGIYIGGGGLVLKTGTYGIKFGDGSTMNTAPGLDVGNSTITFVTATGSSQNSADPTVCPANSTATVTCNTTCRLLMSYQATHQAGSSNIYVNHIVNGARTPFLGGSTAPCAGWDNGSQTAGITCTYLSQTLAAGTHTVCPAVGTNGGGAIRNGAESVVPTKASF